MFGSEQSPSVSKVILIAIAAGVVAALVCVAVLRIIGVESNTAVIGGVVGGVTGAVLPNVVRGRSRS